MTEMTINTPYGHTIFCDDIRQEVGGKATIIGIYSGYLICPELPIFLPKFGTYITYLEDAETDIPDLKLEIYFPGNEDDQPAFVLDVPLPPKIDRSRSGHLGEQPMRGMVFPIVHPPIQIDQEGPIKVRMRRGKDTVKLGMLYVMTADRFGELASTPSPATE